jgi:hypothetical protein
LTTRNKLLFTEIWSTTFVFQDIYNESNEEFKKYVDSLNDTDLGKFINENHHSWGKGFEAGMMSNWDTVARTVAENTTLSKVN